MKIQSTKIPGVVILKPIVFEDERGYFFESYNTLKYNQVIGEHVFLQDNESKSQKGTLRGMHFQLPPYDQAKLVRVIQGKVLDVVVDIRKSSSTFGEYVMVELSEENKYQLFIPKGFAHGFLVLSETATFAYKVDNIYNKASEGSIRWDDTTLNIPWPINEIEILLSDKDKNAPNLQDALVFP